MLDLTGLGWTLRTGGNCADAGSDRGSTSGLGDGDTGTETGRVDTILCTILGSERNEKKKNKTKRRLPEWSRSWAGCDGLYRYCSQKRAGDEWRLQATTHNAPFCWRAFRGPGVGMPKAAQCQHWQPRGNGAVIGRTRLDKLKSRELLSWPVAGTPLTRRRRGIG